MSVGFAHVVLSKSTNGGKTWSTPIKLNTGSGTSQAFTPAVAVADNGAVGVTFYDFRNNTGAAGLPRGGRGDAPSPFSFQP